MKAQNIIAIITIAIIIIAWWSRWYCLYKKSHL